MVKSLGWERKGPQSSSDSPNHASRHFLQVQSAQGGQKGGREWTFSNFGSLKCPPCRLIWESAAFYALPRVTRTSIYIQATYLTLLQSHCLPWKRNNSDVALRNSAPARLKHHGNWTGTELATWPLTPCRCRRRRGDGFPKSSLPLNTGKMSLSQVSSILPAVFWGFCPRHWKSGGLLWGVSRVYLPVLGLFHCRRLTSSWI